MISFNRSKTPTLIRLCSVLRKFKTKSPETKKQEKLKRTCAWRTRFKSKSQMESASKMKLTNSTHARRSKLTMSYKKWSTKTVKWLELPIWKWIKPRQIWFSVLMRSVPSKDVNRKWSSSKTRWCVDTPTNNNSDLGRSRPLRMLQRLLGTKYSNDLRLKKTNAVRKKNSKKICAMSSITKRVSRQRLLVSVPNWKRESVLNRNSRMPKTSNLHLKLNANRRSFAWRTNSNRNCSSASPRTKDWNRWMLKNVECASRSTNAKLKDCGRKS